MKKILLLLVVGIVLIGSTTANAKDNSVQRRSTSVQGTYPHPFFSAYNSTAPNYPNNNSLGNPHNSPAISTGYYFVDSDDNAPQFWLPSEQLDDTTNESFKWRKIATGPRQQAKTYWTQGDSANMGFPFFRNPSLPVQNSGDFFATGVSYGTDSTDDAIAGPIALNLGGRFNFNGIAYDSVYVSTNGIICLTNRRYFYDQNTSSPTYKQRLIDVKSGTAHDPNSMDWFAGNMPQTAGLNAFGENRVRTGNGVNDPIPDDFGYKYAVLGGQYSTSLTNWTSSPPSPYGGIRARGGAQLHDLLLTNPGNVAINYGSTAGGPLDGTHKAAVIAPFFSDLHLSNFNKTKNVVDEHGVVWYKRDVQNGKFIVYYINAAPIRAKSTNIGGYTAPNDIRPGDDNYVSANAQVVLNIADNSVTILYERFIGGYKSGSQFAPAALIFRYNSICGVRGFARHVNFNRTGGPVSSPFPAVAEYEQYNQYFANEQNPSSPYPRNSLRVKFKQWQNTLRVVDIQYRVRVQDPNATNDFTVIVPSSQVNNYELLAGEQKIGAVQPMAIIQNLSNDIQGPEGINYVTQDLTFQSRFVMVNKATGRFIYNRPVPVDKICLSLVDPNWIDCVQDIDVRVYYLGRSTPGISISGADFKGAAQTYAGVNAFNNKARTGLPTYEYVQIYYPPFEPNEFATDINGKLLNIGRLKAFVIAEAINPATNSKYDDQWPFDDTASVNLFVMKRLDDFSDDVTEYHIIDNVPMPSVVKWVNIEADVANGDDVSRYPLPPRGTYVADNNANYTRQSPVIHLNRKTLDDREPSSSPGGDQIRSFPVNMLGKTGSLLSLSVQRVADKKDWERGYGDNSLVGPEPRALLNGDIFTPFNTTGMSVASPAQIDRLSVQIMRPSNNTVAEITNVGDGNWKVHPRRLGAPTETSQDALTVFGAGGYQRGFLETDKDSSLAAPDGSTGRINSLRANQFDDGIDFEYSRFFIAIPDTFIKWPKTGAKNFRFRIKVAANNDQKCITCIPDDADDFYVDNIRILFKAKETTDIEVTSTKAVWPYTQVPASQATFVPIRMKLSNNTTVAAPFYTVKTRIFKNYSGPSDKPVYCRLELVPNHDPGKEIEFKMPNFNSRLSGPGKYRIESLVKIFSGDLVPLNDTTYSEFEIKYGSSFAYDPVDNVNNDVAEATGKVGRGLNLEAFADGGSGSASGPTSGYDEVAQGAGYVGGSISGSIAMKFELSNADTIFGFQAYFGTINQAPDAITFAVHRDAGNNPGAIINNSLIYRVRGRDDYRKDFFFGQYVDYQLTDNVNKPAPLVLSSGTYWISISQLGETGLELGASKSRMGMKTMVVGIPAPIYIPKPVGGPGSSFLIHKEFRNLNTSGSLVNNNFFSVENSRGSGQWLGFSPSTGNPAFSHLHHFGTIQDGGNTLTLTRGGWMPMIRPSLGVKGFETKINYIVCSDEIPVELTTFKGASRNNGIDLFWETASEINSDKFIVEKRNAKSDDANDWAQTAQIKAAGSSKVTNSYNWTDRNVAPKQAYQYRLRQVDLDGTQNCNTTNIVTVTYDKDAEFALYPNSPNPFANNTNITYTVPANGNVKVDVLDVSGNVVATVQNDEVTAGTHTLNWDGRSNNGGLLSSGSYICRISANGRTETAKMTINR